MCLWSEHLDARRETIAGDLTAVIEERWRPLADEQLERRLSGQPTTDQLVRLPRVSRRTQALRGPVNGLFVDG